MRGGYIRPARTYNADGTLHRESGCRGGIGGNNHHYGGDDYEVEVGHSCNFSMEMFAFCCMYDEIMEVLKTSSKDSAVAALVLNKLYDTRKYYEADYKKRGEEVRKQDAEYAKKYNEDKQREKDKRLREARNG